jgi:hypothetical protein
MGQAVERVSFDSGRAATQGRQKHLQVRLVAYTKASSPDEQSVAASESERYRNCWDKKI